MTTTQNEYCRQAARHAFTVIVRDGSYRDSIGGHAGETVEQVIARRFSHCGGTLPTGWSFSVISAKGI